MYCVTTIDICVHYFVLHPAKCASFAISLATLLCLQVLIQHLHAIEPRTTNSVTHNMFTGAQPSREKERALCLHLKITLNIRYYITSFSITVNFKRDPIHSLSDHMPEWNFRTFPICPCLELNSHKPLLSSSASFENML